MARRVYYVHKILVLVSVFYILALVLPASRVRAQPLSVEDLRRNNIDVHAQYSLRRMSEQGGTPGQVAREIHGAVVSGQLAGIYIVDQQVPAKRAQRLGTSWWLLIPKGRDSICMLEPAGENPMIVFRSALHANPAALDLALQAAWRECSLNKAPSEAEPKAPSEAEPKAPSEDESKAPSEAEASCRVPFTFVAEPEPKQFAAAERTLRSGSGCKKQTGITLSLWQNTLDGKPDWPLMIGSAMRIQCPLQEPSAGSCDNFGPSMYATGQDILRHIQGSRACGKEIEMMHVFGHSFPDGIIGLTKNSGLYTQQLNVNGNGAASISQIDASAFADDAIVILHGCNTAAGAPGKNNFAKELYDHLKAKRPNVTVYGHPASVCVGEGEPAQKGTTWREYSKRSPDGKKFLTQNPHYQGHSCSVQLNIPHPSPVLMNAECNIWFKNNDPEGVGRHAWFWVQVDTRSLSHPTQTKVSAKFSCDKGFKDEGTGKVRLKDGWVTIKDDGSWAATHVKTCTFRIGRQTITRTCTATGGD